VHKLPVRFQFVSPDKVYRFTLVDFKFVLEPNADHRLVFELPGFGDPIAIGVFEIVTIDIDSKCLCWVSCETRSFEKSDEANKLFEAFSDKYGDRITDILITDLRKEGRQ